MIELIDDGGVLHVGITVIEESRAAMSNCQCRGGAKHFKFHSPDECSLHEKCICKHCNVPVVSFPMPGMSSGVYWTHDFGNELYMVLAYNPYSSQTHAAEPRPPAVDLSLWIYLPSTRRWECHQPGSLEVRDRLRAIWRAAGCATAVSV